MRHSPGYFASRAASYPARHRPTSILRSAIASGTVATGTSAVALAFLALAAGKGAAQPLNATSHWLYGDDAAKFPHADADHTGVGFATHHAATIFWALFFEGWLARRPVRTAAGASGRAAAVAVLAAAVDYTITPRRFTPGWELVLSKRAMAAAYLAMAAGFAAVAIGRR